VTVKYGHNSHGTQAREEMTWRSSRATVNYKPVLSSERALHNKKREMSEYNIHWKKRKIIRWSEVVI
jgi:hypothetical protein